MKQLNKNITFSLDKAVYNAQATSQISQSQAISLADAYDIQKISLAQRHQRGEKLMSYKLGFTSRAKMEQMGVHDIIWGQLTDKMKIINGQTLTKSKFIHPRVEPEIVFLIAKPIDEFLTLKTAGDYLQGVAGALEIIDSRYENFKFSLEDVIADNCSSSAYVIGEWLPPTTPLQNLAISLVINEKTSQTGNSNAILGNLLASLVEMAKMAQKYELNIELRQVILAGAATSAVYIQAGDKIEGQFEGLGTVHLKVIA